MKKLLIASLISIASLSAHAEVSVQVTAANQITPIPANFGAPRFVLDKPWFTGELPGFSISSVPTTDVLLIDPDFNIPGISIEDHVAPNKGLTWFYYCDGLKFNYTGAGVSTATVVFTGTVDPHQPGGNVQCTCSGSACSTTESIPARLMIVQK